MGTGRVIHHVELWVPSLAETVRSWGWLLTSLGYEEFQNWPAGRSWRQGDTYLVFEQSPAMTAGPHERLRPGLNHLALHAGTPGDLDLLVAEAPAHGWAELFPRSAGQTAYLVDAQGYEVELVPRSIERVSSAT